MERSTKVSELELEPVLAQKPRARAQSWACSKYCYHLGLNLIIVRGLFSKLNMAQQEKPDNGSKFPGLKALDQNFNDPIKARARG